jgi:hypothetical protein
LKTPTNQNTLSDENGFQLSKTPQAPSDREATNTYSSSAGSPASMRVPVDKRCQTVPYSL